MRMRRENLCSDRGGASAGRPSRTKFGGRSKAARSGRALRRGRKGAASLDYVLILAVLLPLVALSIAMSKLVMGLAYEVLCVLVSWPFM